MSAIETTLTKENDRLNSLRVPISIPLTPSSFATAGSTYSLTTFMTNANARRHSAIAKSTW